MSKRSCCLSLIAIALVFYFEPTHCVRGWVWGEAFFDGRPTSYWRSVIEADISEPAPWDENYQPTVWESACTKCGICSERQRSNVLITDTDVEAVLAELGEDRSPRVRAFAEAIIAYNTNELPRLAETQWSCGTDVLEKWIAWNRAVFKARAIPDTE